MSLRDKLAIRFNRFMGWAVAHDKPVKTKCECDEECKFRKHLNEIEIGHEGVSAS